MAKWVYSFSSEKTDGNKNQKDLLGGKGANLAEMCNLKLPVPPGFTVSTEACLDYYNTDKKISDEVRGEVKSALAEVEKITGQEVWRQDRPASLFRSLGGKSFHARDDGHGP